MNNSALLNCKLFLSIFIILVNGSQYLVLLTEILIISNQVSTSERLTTDNNVVVWRHERKVNDTKTQIVIESVLKNSNFNSLTENRFQMIAFILIAKHENERNHIEIHILL